MKVLIGYDGSDAARSAIHALQRAGLPHDAEVLVATVADVSLPPSHHDAAVGTSGWENAPIVKKAQALAAEARAEAQALAAEGAELVKTEFPNWNVAHAAYAGSPSNALIELPDRAPDLVVVGSQGKSALGRLVLEASRRTC